MVANDLLELWVGVITQHLTQKEWEDLTRRVRTVYAGKSGYPEVIEILRACPDNLIQAVKAYRQVNPVSIHDALDAVLELNYQHGFPPRGRPNSKGEPR